MNDPQKAWDRLVKAARQAPAPAENQAPFGFATRVVANWKTAPAPSMLPVWELFARRILVFGCAAMFLCLALNAGFLQQAFSPDADPIAAAQAGLDIPLLEE